MAREKPDEKGMRESDVKREELIEKLADASHQISNPNINVLIFQAVKMIKEDGEEIEELEKACRHGYFL